MKYVLREQHIQFGKRQGLSQRVSAHCPFLGRNETDETMEEREGDDKRGGGEK